MATDLLGVSRGTIREAMKVLEFQGLTRTKTGPGCAVFVTEGMPGEAIQMLDNLFLFKAPSISDIYSIGKKLEPELAASVAGKLSDVAIDALLATVRLHEDEPTTTEEEYHQRLAELDFHTELVHNCDNALLSFVCKFRPASCGI